MDIWQTFFIQPILNALVLLVDFIPGHDLGWAIIVLTVIIRLALLPLSWKAIKSQYALKELQPELERIKQQYKDDKQGQQKALLDFYKQNKINPLSSCLPILIQIPKMLYPWVPNPGKLSHLFLGILDLSKPDKFVLPLLAGGLQFLQSWMMMPKGKNLGQEANLSKQMTYLMPIMTVMFAFSLPSGLPLYWVVTTLVAIVQQAVIKPPKPSTVKVIKREER
jgi:YidC/Oxa1 family membrane protein insertase